MSVTFEPKEAGGTTEGEGIGDGETVGDGLGDGATDGDGEGAAEGDGDGAGELDISTSHSFKYPTIGSPNTELLHPILFVAV
jgi:hypothetical protein